MTSSNKTKPQNLAESFIKNGTIVLKQNQYEVLLAFCKFLENHYQNESIFILKGYAGTGKTTLISLIAKGLAKLRRGIYLMAPTGRAAKVMSLYSGRPAFTIHRTIFRTSDDGKRVTLQKNYLNDTLFIVDEASMIACTGEDNLASPLLEYIFSGEGNKLLLVGDTAQLPPVSQPESLALDPAFWKSRFSQDAFEALLSEVIRQEADSGILANATALRNNIARDIPKVAFHTKAFPDIYRMTGERLQEGLEYAYLKYEKENTLIVCRSNKTASQYNQYIRSRLLYYENELDGGDLIMVVRNNYFYSPDGSRTGYLANGDFARIKRVRRTHEQHGLQFADVDLEMVDYPDLPAFEAKVILDTLHTNTASLGKEESEKLYQAVAADYADIPNKRERQIAIKQDPFLNALQIKFAYALTCHKAQGGQWDAVFVEQGYLPDETITKDFQRWLYTACTRAKKELFLVNFSGRFFDYEAWAEAII